MLPRQFSSIQPRAHTTPALFAAPQRWQSDAACADEDPELFVGPDREPPQVRRRREAIALAVCGRCTVRATCLAWAIATPRLDYGVAGGMGERERDTYRRLLEGSAAAGALDAARHAGGGT